MQVVGSVDILRTIAGHDVVFAPRISGSASSATYERTQRTGTAEGARGCCGGRTCSAESDSAGLPKKRKRSSGHRRASLCIVTNRLRLNSKDATCASPDQRLHLRPEQPAHSSPAPAGCLVMASLGNVGRVPDIRRRRVIDCPLIHLTHRNCLRIVPRDLAEATDGKQ